MSAQSVSQNKAVSLVGVPFFGLAAACMRTSAGGMAGGDEAGRSVGDTFAKTSTRSAIAET